MKRFVALCAFAAAIVGVSAAQAAVESNETITESISGEMIPCANGGVGELVSGDILLHVLFTSTVNRNTMSGKFHFQPTQGSTLVGETTGDVYRATGVTQGTFSGPMTNGRYTETFVNNFRIIGPGPGNNFLVHEVFHVTINANGETTIERESLSVDCK
jgi:hypothetical protein